MNTIELSKGEQWTGLGLVARVRATLTDRIHHKPVLCRSRTELPVYFSGHCTYNLTEMEEYAGDSSLILQCKQGTELTLVGNPERVFHNLALQLNGFCTLRLQDIYIENKAAPILHLHGRSNRIQFCGSNRLCTPPEAVTVIAAKESDFSITPEAGEAKGSMTITGGVLRCGDEIQTVSFC